MVGGDRGGSQPPTAAAPPSMQQAQRGKAEQPVTRGATYAMFFAKVDASLGSSWDSPLPYTRFLPPESTAPAAAPATAAASAMGATARERVSVHAAWLEYTHRRLCGSCAPPTLLTDGPTAISATGTATVTAAGRDAGATSGAGCAAVAELEAGSIAGEGTSPSFQA
jgi:hypothetical protein